MAILAVPLDVGRTHARVWIGALDEPLDPAEVRLTSNLGASTPDPAAWRVWESDDRAHRLTFQRVRVDGLASDSPYRFDLRVDDRSRSRASLRTLPERLPGRDEPPFVVFLGSCFHRRTDKAGRAGQLYARLPEPARPRVKFLCGDQVYLDSPWYRFLLWRHGRERLQELHFEKYAETWTQESVDGGFRRILSEGATWFTADDHEFWNNAPNRGSFIPDSWSSSRRADWKEIALSLYRSFQTDDDVASFDVGRLSFFVADTRVNRREDRSGFMAEDDLAALEGWLAGLRGPGVLVVGQPLLTEEAGWRGHVADWRMPDYDQYGRLARAILSCEQPLVLLTGDVHYARISRGQLASGKPLIEVISSPTALVDRLAEGEWSEAPGRFPAGALPGPAPLRPIIHTEPEPSTNDDHFQTLEFWRTGRRVRMRVRLWRLDGTGSPPVAESFGPFDLS